MYEREKLDNFLLDCEVVAFEDVEMNKGRKSPYYVNLRKVPQRGYPSLRQFSYHAREFYEDMGFEGIFVGIPSCATHFANEANKELLHSSYAQRGGSLNIPPIELRKTPKNHGSPLDKHFVIYPPKNSKIILFEDTTTVARTISEKIPHVKEAGYEIEAVVCIVDRLELSDDEMHTARSVVEDLGYPFYSMTDISTLLPAAVDRLKPSEERISKIRSYPHFAISCPI